MNGTPLILSRKFYLQIFFFIAFAFFLYQLFILIKPFLPVFLVSALLAMAFQPVFVRLKRKVRNVNLSAFIMTTGIFILTVIPLVILGVVFFSEAGKLFVASKNFMEAFKGGDTPTAISTLPSIFRSPAEYFSNHLQAFFSYADLNFKSLLLEKIQTFGSRLVAMGGQIARNLLLAGVYGLIMFITLFFAFRDGESLVNKVLALIPMEEDHKETVARRAYETFRAVAVGVFITAFVQGLMAMLGFWIAGVELPVLFGFLTMVASLVGASFLVTFPVAFTVFIASKGWGMFLFLWSALVVGLLDNFLRPYLIGARIKMPFFVMLFSILAGLKAYGLLGIVLGPVLVGTVITFVRIYRQEYGEKSPPIFEKFKI